MMTKSSRSIVRSVAVCCALLGVCASRASAVVLFQDNFNTDTSLSWNKNAAPTANAGTQIAEFGFDYAGFGIPAAPGSSDTVGLRLRANVPADTSRPAGVVSGLSMSPKDQNFGTNYKMQFYAWSNFCGAANANGLADNAASEGGTANVFFGVGTSGTVPMVVGNTGLAANGNMDGIGFATTGDGGIASDFRVYPKSGTISTAASGVYAAGTANDAGNQTPMSNANVYYTAMPSLAPHTAPEVQQTLSTNEYGGDAANTQLGSTQAGAFGFAWHKVVIAKNNNVVTWDIDDTRIATINVASITMGGNNIALGVSDVNTSTTRHPSLVFTIFDNLVVEDIAPVGVPGDYNGNGVVDAADYVLYRNGGPLQNEVNSAGTVDSTDYDAWRARFGNNSGSGSGAGLSTAVPEPASLLLLAFGAGIFLVRRRA